MFYFRLPSESSVSKSVNIKTLNIKTVYPTSLTLTNKIVEFRNAVGVINLMEFLETLWNYVGIETYFMNFFRHLIFLMTFLRSEKIIL